MINYNKYILPKDYYIRDDLPFYTWKSKGNKFRIHYIEDDNKFINMTVFAYDKNSQKWFEATNNEQKRDTMLMSILFSNVNSGLMFGTKAYINKKMKPIKYLSPIRIELLNKLYNELKTSN